MNLAPNGKKSNLTKEQYKLVRTSAFKKWFGDWENDAENSSKVVDSNGEPLVIYRGNREQLGYEFTLGHNLLKKPTINNFGHFFTPDKFVAKRYAEDFVKTMIGLYKDKPNYDYVLEEGYILKVFLNAKNLLDLTKLGSKSYGEKFVKHLKESGISFLGFEDLISEVQEFNYTKDFDGSDINANVYDFFDNFPKLRELFIKNNISGIKFYENSRGGGITYVVFDSNQIKLADGTNTTFDVNNPDIRYKAGGEIQERKETYKKWKSLVNMSKTELERFYNSQEGKDAGLSSSEASSQGISSGRESARWIMRMKDTPVSEWTPSMWRWANKQISFISRMSGNKGPLYDEKGRKTRKHTSLLIWGHNPKKYELGGGIEDVNTNTIELLNYSVINDFQ